MNRDVRGHGFHERWRGMVVTVVYLECMTFHGMPLKSRNDPFRPDQQLVGPFMSRVVLENVWYQPRGPQPYRGGICLVAFSTLLEFLETRIRPWLFRIQGTRDFLFS